MIITPRNWMNLVASTFDLLPADLRQRIKINADIVDPGQCPSCTSRWFYLSPVGPRCATCYFHALAQETPVELSAQRPRVCVFRDEQLVASAVLLRREKCVEVVVPEGQEATYRVNSRKPEHAANALQGRLRALVLPSFGLAIDAEGAWGWPKTGQRLQGGAMVRYPIDALDDLG